MSRASTLARAFGADGVFNVADVAGLGALASLNSVGSAQMDSGAAVANIGYTPVNKAGDTMTGGLFRSGVDRVYHASGGEWAVLGSVWGDSFNQYIHVKTNFSRWSYKMIGFRLSGFFPYSAYGHGFLGCYTYGEDAGPNSPPHGIVVHNAGTSISVAHGMYYSADNNIVLVLNWPTAYNGVLVEAIANGGSYGNITGNAILAFTKSNNTSGVY